MLIGLISRISGLKKSYSFVGLPLASTPGSGNLLTNALTISSGISGLCSISLSSSALQLEINTDPSSVLSLTGRLSSTLIFLANLE